MKCPCSEGSFNLLSAICDLLFGSEPGASYRLAALALKPSGPALVEVVHIVFGDRQKGNFNEPVWRVFAVLYRVEKEIDGAGSPIINLLGKQLIGIALSDILKGGWMRDNSSQLNCARGPF